MKDKLDLSNKTDEKKNNTNDPCYSHLHVKPKFSQTLSETHE